MKKYEKPTIVIERFELNQSIANCSPAMGHQKNGCEYDSSELEYLIEPGETVFVMGDCTYSEAEFLEMFNDFCLQTSIPGHTLFTS